MANNSKDNRIALELPEMDSTNTRQMQALELVCQTNQSFFLTGRAGTGKTTFLKNIQRMSSKQFIVVAPTGIAAIVAEGVTIHSFFGFDLNVLGPTDYGQHFSEDKVALVRNCDTIIIDEVSMVRCDIVDAIDRTLRVLLKNPYPFGGKQVIFSGDMFQLPPVLQKGAEAEAMKAYYNTDKPYFFKAHVFDHLTLPTIEFVKVYRQEEQLFLNILSDIRGGVCTQEDLDELNSRCVEPETGDPVIALTPRKDSAKKINDKELAELESEEHFYEGKVEGSFGKKDNDGNWKDDSLPAPMNLVLKEGAQVMFTRNDTFHRWVNGTLGTVVSLSEDGVTVRIGENECDVEKVTWESYDYTFDKGSKKLNKKVAGTYEQFPLRLAWAITIHKSQGLTFDRMKLDLTRGTFESGQLYVALSRVRSLEGLFLTSPVKESYIFDNEEVNRFASHYNDDQVIESQLAEGKALYPFLKAQDYDGAARMYMELALNQIHVGNHRNACLMFKKMLNELIFDDVLVGSCSDEYLNDADGCVSNFNNAIVSLYSGNYERAIDFADRVLAKRELYEALYIKVRAYTRLGRYTEADDVNVRIDKLLAKEGNECDMKFLASIAEVNQLVGDSYLGIYAKIAIERPTYMPIQRTFCEAMRKEGRLLKLADDVEMPDLAQKFNNASGVDEFMDELEECKANKAKEYDRFISVLAKQVWE